MLIRIMSLTAAAGLLLTGLTGHVCACETMAEAAVPTAGADCCQEAVPSAMPGCERHAPGDGVGERSLEAPCTCEEHTITLEDGVIRGANPSPEAAHPAIKNAPLTVLAVSPAVAFHFDSPGAFGHATYLDLCAFLC